MKHILVPALVLCLAFPAHAQLSTTQQNCVAGMNKAGASVALAQGKQTRDCVRLGHAGLLVGTAEACVGTDGSVVSARKSSTVAKYFALCDASPPSFAHTGPDTVNFASQHGEIALARDLFGNDLDAALPDCTANKDQCLCQKKVLTAAEKIAGLARKAFVGCKKTALPAALDAGDVADCVTDAGLAGSIAAARAAGGKIAAKSVKLRKAVELICDDRGVTAGSFPGSCSGLGGEGLLHCIDSRIACRVCRSFGTIDALELDCDAFDDGLSNSSCVEPSTSTTTTTLPPTTTTLPPTTTTLPPMSTLSIHFPGGGLGRVQDPANGIDCSDSCAVEMPTGTQVNLSVTSSDNPDGRFATWQGPCTGTASPCTIEVDDDVSVDAVFLSALVRIGLGDGPFIGTAPPDYTHSRDARLRLRNEERARSFPGFQELRWTTSPEELRPGIESPPWCISVEGVGPSTINFPAQIWRIFDVYTIVLAVWDTTGSTPVQVGSDAFNVFLSGDTLDSDNNYSAPCP
ncbi:MAG TPA: hypothetical protein VEL28_06045 [Candidatus Binatia bacterium]|nr:hypothetical protein [Candidatus Binatia bacterium]